MKNVEARNLRKGMLITSIMGDQLDAYPLTHIYPNQEPGFVWVATEGIYHEHAYRLAYRLGQYEEVQVIVLDTETDILVNEARSWIEDVFGDIPDLSDQEVMDGINRHYDGGWGQFTADCAELVK